MDDFAKPDPLAFEDEAVLHKKWLTIDEVRDSNPIKSVTVNSDNRMLEVEWASGECQKFPYLWLRDHCRSPQNFHAGHQTRLTDFMELDLDIDIKTTSVNDVDQTITITWSDDHRSEYPANWLQVNRFDQTPGDPIRSIEPVYWDSRTLKEDLMTKFSYTDVMESDQTLYDMQYQLKSVGVALIQGTPAEKGHVGKLSDRIGYICGTSYGLTSQIYASSTGWAFDHPSYGLEYRPLHTDYSFIDQPQGVAVFHCIAQINGEGGAHFFVDGYKAANELRKINPNAFKLLTKPVWEGRVKAWVVNDKHYHHSVSAPITLDENGEVTKLQLCDYWRTSVMRIPVDEVNDLYRALRALKDLLYREDHIFTHRLKPGDMILLHNHRICHGRKDYHDAKPSQVHLETGYFHWDSFDTRMRKVKMNLDLEKRNNNVKSNGNHTNGF